MEEDAPYPYMLFFLGAERLILQMHLPLCVLDEDLDGTEVHMPQRSFSTGAGPDLKTSTCLALPLKSTADPAGLAASDFSCDRTFAEKDDQKVSILSSSDNACRQATYLIGEPDGT